MYLFSLPQKLLFFSYYLSLMPFNVLEDLLLKSLEMSSQIFFVIQYFLGEADVHDSNLVFSVQTSIIQPTHWLHNLWLEVFTV